jgi:hypothetical protein
VRREDVEIDRDGHGTEADITAPQPPNGRPGSR